MINMITLEDNEKAKELRNIIGEAYDLGFIKSHLSDHKDLTIDEFNNLSNEEVRALNPENTTWGKFCSCMDWLDVAVNNFKEPSFTMNEHKNSMELITFIANCDLLIESIEQLWTVSEKNFKIESIDFKSRRLVFQAEEYGKELSDKEYFKNLRSWFGFHGVNGYEKKLPEIEQKVRFFSSWSSFRGSSKPTIMLYSNNILAEKLYGGRKEFEVDKVIQLVNFYYDSIDDLINKITESIN